MIDTVVFRVHRLHLYKQLIEQLKTPADVITTNVMVDPDGVINPLKPKTLYSPSKFVAKDNEKDKIFTAVFYSDTGNHIFLTSSGKRPANSSGYDVHFMVYMDKDYLEINVSIPKYRYGTNVMQFIDYFDTTYNRQFDMFMKFIRDFFTWFSPGQRISEYDIEINRLDLCYNQIFVSEQDANNYLMALKPVFAAKSKASYNNTREYGDSETLVYKTDRYQFKIYRKGLEFKKKDYPILAKRTKVYNSVAKLNLEKLSNVADRTLRYEITYRNSFLNMWFDDEYQKKLVGKYSNVYAYVFGFLKLHERFTTKSKKFFLRSNYEDMTLPEFVSTPTADLLREYTDNNEVLFERKMFKYLYNHFWGYVNEFQITFNNDVHLIEKQFHALNESQALKQFHKVRKTIDKKTGLEKVTNKPRLKNIQRLMFYYNLSKEQDLKMLVKAGTLSASQFFSLKKVFKSVGLLTYNPQSMERRVPTDYTVYRSLFSLQEHG